MNIKEKSWLWYFTFPFAHKNYTTIGNTLYYPKGQTPSGYVLHHEEIHAAQQSEVGIIKYFFLYLFCFPLFWNPWRYKWEFEAYQNGSRWGVERIKKMLKSYKYGWLL